MANLTEQDKEWRAFGFLKLSERKNFLWWVVIASVSLNAYLIRKLAETSERNEKFIHEMIKINLETRKPIDSLINNL